MDIKVIVKQEYDVIVVGGGVAGIAAAVASARNGAETLLIEKSVVLGGLATAGLINWYEPLCDGEGKKMISGISEELIKLSVKYGYSNLPDRWKDDGDKSSNKENGRYATIFSPNIFALELNKYLKENNVDLILDTLATFPKMENKICKGIFVETVEGRALYSAKMVVDATGTAIICDRAGIATEIGDNYFTYITHEASIDNANKLTETNDFNDLRKWKVTGSDRNGNGHPENLNMLRGITAEDVTYYMSLGCEIVLDRLVNQDKNSREVLSIPTMPQYRRIRRIIGESEFCGNENNVIPQNSVGSFGDFRKKGRHYHLPFTTLYSKKAPNIFAAGRIISARGEGWEVTRVIPVAALSGEAAGTAAALCVKYDCDAATLDVTKLQKTLKAQGVLFV